MSARRVILGAACGYSERQIRPFLVSALTNIPECRIVLFVDPGFKISHERVSIVTPDDLALRKSIRSLPKGVPLVSRLMFEVGRIFTGPELSSRYLRASFGIAVARYFWYRDWLNENALSSSDWVLLSDTRDVVFQRDPFDELNQQRLFCGEEPVKLGDCPINSEWFRRAYGTTALDEIASNRVLCSGVSGGTEECVRMYLEKMCDEIVRVGSRILWSSGYDQAVHNQLLRRTEIEPSFCFEQWDSARLTTMHYVSNTSFKLDADNQVRNPSGQVVSILHQYDRHPEFVSWANGKWGNSEV